MLLIGVNQYWIIGLYGNVSYQTRIAYLREKLVIVPVTSKEWKNNLERRNFIVMRHGFCCCKL